MLIIGAKGFAKEVLEVFHQLNQTVGLAFFDDVNHDIGDFLFDIFPILKTEQEVKNHFLKFDNHFTVGIGNPVLRYKLYKKFTELGGVFVSSISPKAEIGSYDISIKQGCNILSGVTISNSNKIGMGCIIYYNSIITHDCIIEDFVEISPSVTILGRCSIGSFTQLGSNAVILPNINIGRNVIIGAGSVVTKNIMDNCTAVGIPAKIIKHNNPLSFEYE